MKRILQVVLILALGLVFSGCGTTYMLNLETGEMVTRDDQAVRGVIANCEKRAKGECPECSSLARATFPSGVGGPAGAMPDPTTACTSCIAPKATYCLKKEGWVVCNKGCQAERSKVKI